MYKQKREWFGAIKTSFLVTAVTLFSTNTNAGEQNITFDKTFRQDSISFHISCPNDSSLNNLTIIPSGLTIDNSTISTEVDGTVTGAEIDDLNRDGFPEIYIYISSAGSGSYGSLVAYSSNQNKSISPIYLPPLEEDKMNSKGYMGHDQFTVMEGNLSRRFPIYNKDDSNAHPTGGTRQLIYKLVPGEASWRLQLKNSTTF
jgi:hypothetical protein